MMTNSATQLDKVNKQIAALRKQFERKGKINIHGFESFTIDISYGGNKHVNVGRVSIGSVSNDEGEAREFYKLVMRQLEGSRKFWIDSCNRDKEELEKILVETNKTIEDEQSK